MTRLSHAELRLFGLSRSLPSSFKTGIRGFLVKLNNCTDCNLEKCTKPIIVFVHLGRNPSRTLNWYACEVEKNVRNKHLCLITDDPSKFFDFPGEVLAYQRTDLNRGFKKFSRTNSSFKKTSGGYWKFTTERLFALSRLSASFSGSHPVIHLESDVLLLATDKQLKKVFTKIEKTSVVRYSKTAGIASVLIAPTLSALNESLDNLGGILLKKRHIFSDMELLGIALNSEILGALPNSPDDAWIVEGAKRYSVFFDGAFFGQYFFGLDPIHTQGKIVNGYVNPESEYRLIDSVWNLEKADDYDGLSLAVVDENLLSFPLCLHIHSKRLVSSPSNIEVFWPKMVADLNSNSFSITALETLDSIHSKKLKLSHRVSIFLYKKYRILTKRF